MSGSGALARCHSIDDLRMLARRRLPAPIFNLMDGGTETEHTLRRNSTAFDDVRLIPRCLVDVAGVDTSTTLLGQKIAWPVICTPTGGSKAFHVNGELAVARSAAKSGTLFTLSTASTFSIEEVPAVAGPKIFQLYVCRDRDFTYSLVERAKRSGYRALTITVDAAIVGKWERFLHTGMGAPGVWPLRTMWSFARHPLWVLQRTGKGKARRANFTTDGEPLDPRTFSMQSPWDPSATWEDVRKIIAFWDGPVALKGIMSPDDARRAVDLGATAVIVSNHGGRTLDGAAAAFEALPEIVEAVGDQIEVILDGGIRRGTHVLKALALGAKACSIGRPYIYGLAPGGEEGVTRALEILRTELVRDMQLAGCPSLASIDRSLIRP